MLSEIRERSSGWFAWIIASLIIITMAFWGVSEYASTAATPVMVKVGDKKITQPEFQEQLSNEQQRMRDRMGGQINNELLNSDGFKRNVLQQMMSRALIEQIAQDEGYRIGNEQLIDIIKKNEYFNENGKFNKDAYQRYLAQTAFSKTQFESRIRQDSRLNQVVSGYAESAFALPDEVRELLLMQAQQRSFDVLTVKKQDFLTQVSVTDEEVQTYYQANQAQFMQPEKMSIQYVQLDVKDIEKQMTVEPEQLVELYEQNKESYSTQQRSQVSHILLKTSETDTPEQVAQQQQKAQQLIEQLNNGADFAELAKQHSQDPGSANNAGDLGWIEAGQMAPEFEQAAFALQQGQISAPVKTQFGLHIIKALNVELPVQQSFEQAKEAIEKDEKQRLAEETLLERLDRLRDLTYEQPDNLESAAQELDLPIQKTELFTRDSGTAIAENPAVRDVAFSEDVLLDNINSEPIEVASNSYIVLRKLDEKPAAAKPLADVKQQIVTLLTEQKASEMAEQKGQELLAKANANWSEAVVNQTVASHTVSLIDNQSNVNGEMMLKVNGMHLGENNQASISSMHDQQGDFHIIRLTQINAGDLTKVSDQVKQVTRQLLENRNGNALLASYMDAKVKEISKSVDENLL